MVRHPAANTEDLGSTPGLGRSPAQMKSQPTAVYLPGKSHGQRSLVGYSPRGLKESDMTEHAQHVGTKQERTPLTTQMKEDKGSVHFFICLIVIKCF